MAAKRTEIIPAILPQSYGELADQIDQIKGLVKSVQVDICDGHFVQSFTWPYKKHDDTFDQMISEQEGCQVGMCSTTNLT